MFLNKVFTQTSLSKELTAAKNEGAYPIALTGLNPTLKGLIIASEDNKATLVTADAAESNMLYNELIALGKKAVILEARDFNLRSNAVYSKEYEHKRINTLSKVIDGDFDILVLDTECLTQRCISKEELSQNKIYLKKDNEYSLTLLQEQLVAMGYTRSSQIEGAGQFSNRGDILDVFSPNADSPVRIDFFGDTVERISTFEIENQRRLEEYECLTLLPATENQRVNVDELNKYLKSIKNKNQKLYDIIEGDIYKNDL